MAITAKDIQKLHEYTSGVLGQADHCAGRVKGVALALLGGVTWRANPDSIRLRRSAGSPANMLWATIFGLAGYVLYAIGLFPGGDWLAALPGRVGAAVTVFVPMLLPLLWLQVRSD